MSHCVRVSKKGLKNLSSLTSLTHLDLSYCREVTNNGLSVLTSLSYLTVLNLAAPRPWRTKSGDVRRMKVGSVEAVQSISTLTGLTALNLHGWRLLTDEGLRLLGARLTALTNLGLRQCESAPTPGCAA
jgi:hypothetical protein